MPAQLKPSWRYIAENFMIEIANGGGFYEASSCGDGSGDDVVRWPVRPGAAGRGHECKHSRTHVGEVQRNADRRQWQGTDGNRRCHSLLVQGRAGRSSTVDGDAECKARHDRALLA